MRTYQVDLASTSKSIAELTGDREKSSQVIVQSLPTNANNVYFGEQSKEFAFILPSGALGVEDSAKNIFVKGTAPDKINVVIL